MFTNLPAATRASSSASCTLITELENTEADPDQLANLFRLDHLATRMRRNGENLLVLAGEEPGRRWNQPVPLVDVLRAAASEVEQYERIELTCGPAPRSTASAVTDLVHLLAELLENATTFSSPQTVVTVAGWPAKLTKEATIVIEDRGLGMTESGLVDANDRVSAPIAIDVAASERMGLVVVGHLAARHGVQVRLDATDEGVTAYVTLPARLLAAPPEGAGLYHGSGNRIAGMSRLPIAPDGEGRAGVAVISPRTRRRRCCRRCPPGPASPGREGGVDEDVPAVAAPRCPWCRSR